MFQSIESLTAIDAEIHASKVYVLLLNKCFEYTEAKFFVVNH